MRIPFTKSPSPFIPSAADSEFAGTPVANHGSNGTCDGGSAPEVPLMDAPLSPATQSNALHLVGSIREILVGDQIRGLDSRFVYLRDTLLSHFSSLIANLSSETKADREKTRSEIETINVKIDEKSGELESQDAKAAEANKIASMRINSIEETVSSSITQLRAEDERAGAELNSALDRIVALENQLAKKSVQIDQMYAKAGQEIQRSMNRIDALETNLKQTAESLRNQESRLSEKVQITIMRIGSLEEHLVKHIEEMRRQEIAIRDEMASGKARAGRVEEGTEAFRCAFNDKMRELCDYVSSQVGEFSRAMARQKVDFEGQLAERRKPAINPVFAAAAATAPPMFPQMPIATHNGSNGH